MPLYLRINAVKEITDWMHSRWGTHDSQLWYISGNDHSRSSSEYT